MRSTRSRRQRIHIITVRGTSPHRRRSPVSRCSSQARHTESVSWNCSTVTPAVPPATARLSPSKRASALVTSTSRSTVKAAHADVTTAEGDEQPMKPPHGLRGRGYTLAALLPLTLPGRPSKAAGTPSLGGGLDALTGAGAWGKGEGVRFEGGAVAAEGSSALGVGIGLPRPAEGGTTKCSSSAVVVPLWGAGRSMAGGLAVAPETARGTQGVTGGDLRNRLSGRRDARHSLPVQVKLAQSRPAARRRLGGHDVGRSRQGRRIDGRVGLAGRRPSGAHSIRTCAFTNRPSDASREKKPSATSIAPPTTRAAVCRRLRARGFRAGN